MRSTRSTLPILCLTAVVAAPSIASAQDEPPPVHEGGGGGGGGGWDAKFGAIPSGSYITAELGFSNLPKFGYHLGVSRNFEVGGAFAFDIGYYAPDAAVTPGLLFSVPMRIGLGTNNRITMGLLLEPGIQLYFPGGDAIFGLNLNGAFNIGYEVNNQFTVGGGVDFPIALRFTPRFVFVFPILFGPVLEVHPGVPNLGITFDAKFGPHINAGDGGSAVIFGLKLNVGIAYRF